MATLHSAPTTNEHYNIDDSVVPGTVHLVDLNQTSHAQHSRSKQDIILVPTPSHDPDDPLNVSVLH